MSRQTMPPPTATTGDGATKVITKAPNPAMSTGKRHGADAAEMDKHMPRMSQKPSMDLQHTKTVQQHVSAGIKGKNNVKEEDDDDEKEPTDALTNLSLGGPLCYLMGFDMDYMPEQPVQNRCPIPAAPTSLKTSRRASSLMNWPVRLQGRLGSSSHSVKIDRRQPPNNAAANALASHARTPSTDTRLSYRRRWQGLTKSMGQVWSMRRHETMDGPMTALARHRTSKDPPSPTETPAPSTASLARTTAVSLTHLRRPWPKRLSQFVGQHLSLTRSTPTLAATSSATLSGVPGTRPPAAHHHAPRLTHAEQRLLWASWQGMMLAKPDDGMFPITALHDAFYEPLFRRRAQLAARLSGIMAQAAFLTDLLASVVRQADPSRCPHQAQTGMGAGDGTRPGAADGTNRVPACVKNDRMEAPHRPSCETNVGVTQRPTPSATPRRVHRKAAVMDTDHYAKMLGKRFRDLEIPVAWLDDIQAALFHMLRTRLSANTDSSTDQRDLVWNQEMEHVWNKAYDLVIAQFKHTLHP